MMTRIARFSLAALAMAGLVACSGKDKAAVSKTAFVSSVTPAAKAASTSLALGTPVTGALEASDPIFTDSSHYDQWTYDGRRGERIQITLASTTFDTYVLLGRQSGAQVEMMEENDDDGTGGTNSRLNVELPEDGTYVVFANSYGGGATGAYTLRVDPAPAGSTSQGPAMPVIDFAARYPGGGDPKGRYAVVVGIEDYRGIGNSLSGTVADAQLMGRLLVERYGFLPANIVTITDREATREHIAEAFRRHLGQAGPDGVAVFYYSGHGMRLEENLGTQDLETDQVDEALYMWGANGRGGVLLDDELGALANGLGTDRVLMVLDACFSGTGSRGAAGTAGMAKVQDWDSVGVNVTLPTTFVTDPSAKAGAADGLAEPSRHLLLAASSDQQLSWTATGWPKYGGTISVFTYYLAEAIEASAQNATFTQIMNDVSQKTDDYTQATYNARQEPRPEGRSSNASIREFLRQR